MIFTLDIIKSVFLGIIEGITEWLPISSTGHLILSQTFLSFSSDVAEGFTDMFNYVIQFGAIIAVIVLFWHKLWSFKKPQKGGKMLSCHTGILKKDQWILWFKVLVATLPSVLALPVDSKMEELLYDANDNPTKIGIIVISIALVFYGILFIIIERMNNKRSMKVNNVTDITYKLALLIGAFQMLAVIPGTSRSGATIMGALIIGVARPAAAEFSFFMAIPTMVGVSALKIGKFLFENSFKSNEIIILLVGMVVSFLVSFVCIKKLMEYVKKRDFSFFGWYRIVLGILVIAYSLVMK